MSVVLRMIVVLVLVSCSGTGRKEPAPDPGIRWPLIVDSHVHVSYWPVADELARTGIGAVVDLAAPEASLGRRSPLTVIAAGPMLTRPDGYPLESWGREGYGIPCADVTCIETTIDRLAGKGARVIKLALGDDGLDPALVVPAVERAHARGLKVAVHALDDASAKLAGDAGVDVLAHTPAERLSDATVAAWRGKAVISTLAAFNAPAAPDNLARLRTAGCAILYGTDLGNLRDAKPSLQEIALLRQAGLDDAAITAAMTTTPIAFWGIPANNASFLLLDRDPRVDASALLHPKAIWVEGKRVR